MKYIANGENMTVLRVRLDFFGPKNYIFKDEAVIEPQDEVDEPESSFGLWLEKGSLTKIAWHICAYLLWSEPNVDEVCTKFAVPVVTGVIG